MSPRACRCGHALRTHEQRRGADRCGRCPCRKFHPPCVGTRRDRVLRAFIMVMMLLGLAAATALFATRGGVDGASATQSLNEAESPPGDRTDAPQASTDPESVSTPAGGAPEPGTVPIGTVEPTGAEQATPATDSESPTAAERPVASSAEQLPAGRSSAGAPVSESSSPAGPQGPAPAAPSPSPSPELAPAGPGSVVPVPPSLTAAPVPQPALDPITPSPAPTSAPTPSPMPITVAVPDPGQPAPNPAPPATAAEPEPSEQAGARYPTAEDDPAREGRERREAGVGTLPSIASTSAENGTW